MPRSTLRTHCKPCLSSRTGTCACGNGVRKDICRSSLAATTSLSLELSVWRRRRWWHRSSLPGRPAGWPRGQSILLDFHGGEITSTQSEKSKRGKPRPESCIDQGADRKQGRQKPRSKARTGATPSHRAPGLECSAAAGCQSLYSNHLVARAPSLGEALAQRHGSWLLSTPFVYT